MTQPRTRLVALVDDQVAESVINTITRSVDRIADSLAEELLRDPQVRADLLVLVRDAFKRAVDALNQPKDIEP